MFDCAEYRHLTRALASADALAREEAAWNLGRLGAGPERPLDPRPLAVALGDASPRVRRAAAWALGRLGKGAASAEALIATLTDDEEATVRWLAAQALGELGGESHAVLDALTTAVRRDSDPRVRAAAARALGVIGSPLVVSALVEALVDPDPHVAPEAAQALRRIESAREDPTIATLVAAVTTGPWSLAVPA